jgi:hypothetical protein
MTSEQHYVLPVATIIETMIASPFLVQLHTSFSSLPNITKEPCLAELIVGQGKLHTCQVMTHTGHLLLEREGAIARLQHCGSVQWTLLPVARPDMLQIQAAPVPRQTSPPNTSFTSGCPQRIHRFIDDQMHALSHGQKHVFALVDGRKTVEHIARLLSKQESDVQQILQTLQDMHLISL